MTVRLPAVALVRQRYNPAGGAERFVSRALAALAGGASLTLITRHWEEVDGVTPLIVDPFYLGNLWRDWSFARGVRHALAEHRFDLVQSHERIAGCDVYRAGDGVHRCYLERRRARLGAAGRAKLALNPYHRYMVDAEERLFASPRLRAVICISRMVRDEIRAQFSLPEEKLHLIYNGIDLESFHPRLRAAHRDSMRSKLGVRPGELLLAFVGSGFERKGVAVLLEALARTHVPCRAVIVGRDKHAARYERLAQRLGVADRATFAGVAADPRPYYAAADALVLPTLYEPFGNVNLEAMACALPVLTSKSCGAAELLQEGESGFVRDAGDAAGFAAAIDALQDPDNATHMGRNARRVAEGFPIAAMAEKMTALYRQLLAA